MSGGLTTLPAAKAYHGLLVLAASKGWEYDRLGEMSISLADLHRLTNKVCPTWEEYLQVLVRIRDTVRLDWENLSRSIDGLHRVGTTPILSEVQADRDAEGDFSRIIFRIPQALVEYVIKPKWYGQVDPRILFSLKSNYAFHAYLYASVTVVEKDNTKDEFFSHVRSQSEWEEILGISEPMPPNRFRQNILRRIEKSIAKTITKTDNPIRLEFLTDKCAKNCYQMRVVRIRNESPTPTKPIVDVRSREQSEQRERSIREAKRQEEELRAWWQTLPLARRQVIVAAVVKDNGEDARTDPAGNPPNMFVLMMLQCSGFEFPELEEFTERKPQRDQEFRLVSE